MHEAECMLETGPSIGPSKALCGKGSIAKNRAQKGTETNRLLTNRAEIQRIEINGPQAMNRNGG